MDPRRSLASTLASESSCTPLDAAPTTLVQDPRLNHTFRALFGGELRACTVGWPRRVHDRSAALPWLRQGDVLVELARSPAAEPLTLGISLHAEGATRLAEALLGAPVSSRLPSAAGQPSEAECGLLSYAAARLLASLPHRTARVDTSLFRRTAAETSPPQQARDVGPLQGADWLVRDVRRLGLADSLDECACVLWPIAIDGSLGRVEATLWLSASLTRGQGALHTVEVVLFEQLTRPDDEALVRGEVWISDHWSLTNTSDGLTGSVVLQVPGCATALDAQLQRNHVRATGVRLAPSTTAHQHTSSASIEFVLARPASSFLQLAELAQGARHYVGDIGAEPVLLRRGGQVLAEGELVTWRGALGVRLTGV